MNFLWSYGRNCSKAQQKSGCLNEAKPGFETESVSVRVGKSGGNLTNPLSVHIFSFDKTNQCQILSLRRLVHPSLLLDAPPPSVIVGIIASSDSCLVCFPHSLQLWLSLWLPPGNVSIKTLLWSFIKAGISRDLHLFFLFAFENRLFPKTPAGQLHIY